MTSAAFFLITRNLKNRVVRWVIRLRQPRYLAGAIAAGIYFWFFLFRRRNAVHFGAAAFTPMNDLFAIGVTLLALIVIVGAWGLPEETPGFVFSEAEIQFLFAAPVTRRQLLAYKTVRSQVAGFFTAIVLSFFVFGRSHFIGLWASLAALDVYTTFVSFARARLKLAGIGWLWRLLAVSVAFIAIIAAAMRQFRGSGQIILNALQQPRREAIVSTFTHVVWQPPLATILFVPKIVGTAMYGQGSTALLALTILLAATFALFFLTTQLDVSFEDASIVASQRALTRRARMRGRRFGSGSVAVHRFPPPFRLAPTGRPEVAVVWKNLIAAMRVSSFPIIAILMPLVFAAAASIFGRHGDVAGVIGLGCLMTTALFAFVGPQAVRADLRLDILRLDIVKTFPLSAEVLLAAELAAPLMLIALFELLMLVVSIVVLNFAGHQFAFFTKPEFVVGALVFIIPVSAIQLLIQNAAIILLPAWSTSTDPGRGITALGQRLLLFFANIVTLAVAVLPAAAVFLPSLWLLPKLFGRNAITMLLATIPAAAVLVIQIVIGHRLLAGQFEDIDIANDLDTATP